MSEAHAPDRLSALLERVRGSDLDGPLRRSLEDELRAAIDESRKLASQNTFIAVISHELRSPLHSVLGNAELLRERTSDPESLELSQAILRSARGLLGLINDLLDISAIEAGSFSLHPSSVSLREIFDDVLAALRPAARARNLDLLFGYDESLPPLILADGQRLAQVLTNLTANALRFTDEGWVEIRASREATNPPSLLTRVTDSGIGVPEAERGELFRPFFRSSSGAHRRGGTGLGLSICHNLVERMGGRIGYQPGGDRGSIFWFSLPLVVAPQTSRPLSAHWSSSPPSTSLPRAILVVDDTETNRVWAQRALASRGFSVVTAESGSQALELLSRRAFDAVLMDWHMPGLDGFETTRKLRELPGPAALTPVIGLSASAIPDAVQRGLDAGMNECLLKPVSIRALCSALARYVEAPPPARPSADPASTPAASTPAASTPADTTPAAPATGEALRIEGLPPELCLELAELFAAHTPAHCDQLEQALEADDSPRVARHAHALASSAGGIQRADLSDLAKGIELSIIRGADCAAVAPAARALCATFRRAAPLIVEATRALLG